MITRYLTSVTARFDPFSKKSKAVRVFLAMIPSSSRGQLTISTTILPRNTKEQEVLDVRFKDGKEMKLNLKELRINEIVEQVNRHSRILQRQEDLAG